MFNVVFGTRVSWACAGTNEMSRYKRTLPSKGSRFMENISADSPAKSKRPVALAGKTRWVYARVMNTWVRCFIILLSITACGAAEVDAPKKVYIVPIREEVSSTLTYVVRRGVKEAMEAK